MGRPRLHGALGPLLALALGCSARPPDLVLIVLDTVRADRLSACGYGEPTSPHLAALAAETRTAFTCFAEAPATWTIPSHASFLTGLPYHEHGTGLGGFRRPAPMPSDLVTLAQQLSDTYQTMVVSGNPLLDEAGLDRGFEVRVIAEGYGDLYGPALVAALDRALARRDASRPLFLLLNISDAHMPWAAIPASHPWLPATPQVQLDDRERELRRLLFSGKLDPAEKTAYLEPRRRLYDHAVERADATLGGAVATLRHNGLLRRGYRLVVTSDHGERLGEDRTFGHGPRDLGEWVTRVPLLFRSDREETPRLPRPLSAVETHALLLHGRLAGAPVVAAGFPRSVAWWGADEKLVWMSSKPLVRYPGIEDTGPGEEVPGHPHRAELQRMARQLVERWEAARQARGEESERLGRELEALGYLDDPD